jgi:hypothetical protein
MLGELLRRDRERLGRSIAHAAVAAGIKPAELRRMKRHAS